jgi:hypothetical protein
MSLTPEEVEGCLVALELALVIALEGRRLNPQYAQALVAQETSEDRLPLASATEAAETLERIFRRASAR